MPGPWRLLPPCRPFRTRRPPPGQDSPLPQAGVPGPWSLLPPHRPFRTRRPPPGQALGDSPRHNPGSPCGSHGGAPFPALHGHRVKGFCGGALPLPGAHVGGQHNLGTGLLPPHTGGRAGSPHILPGDPAGRCPGPQDLARIDVGPRSSAVAHAGWRSPPCRLRVGDGFPGPPGGGASRGPENTALQKLSAIWGRAYTSKAHPEPPGTYRKTERLFGSSSAPSGSPRTQP